MEALRRQNDELCGRLCRKVEENEALQMKICELERNLIQGPAALYPYAASSAHFGHADPTYLDPIQR